MDESKKHSAELNFIFNPPGTIDIKKSLCVTHPMITRVPIIIVRTVAKKEIVRSFFFI